MAKVVTDDSHYKAIADTVREFYGTPEDVYRPSDMADGVRYVAEQQHEIGRSKGYNEGYILGNSDGWSDGYNEGYHNGNEEGYYEGFQEGYDGGFAVGEESGLAEGIEQGKQSEYDRFWDIYQQNGTRIGYTYGFPGSGWNDETFNPKYPITIEQTNSGNYLFMYSTITDTKVPISIRKGAIMTNAFASNTLRVIRKIIVDETVPFANNSFSNATALITVIFEGVIGKNGLNLQWSSKLSKVSITSVVNALSSTTSGLSVTFSKTAVNTAFATTEGGTDGSTSTEWTTLANTKSNWTINLV